MILYALVASGLAVAAIAFAAPYLRQHSSPASISPASKAWWAKRLFALAAEADASGDAQTAAAARSLLDALINPSQPAGKRR